MRDVTAECDAVVAKCEADFVEQIERKYGIGFKPLDRIFILGEVRAASISAFFDGIKYERETSDA